MMTRSSHGGCVFCLVSYYVRPTFGPSSWEPRRWRVVLFARPFGPLSFVPTMLSVSFRHRRSVYQRKWKDVFLDQFTLAGCVFSLVSHYVRPTFGPSSRHPSTSDDDRMNGAVDGTRFLLLFFFCRFTLETTSEGGPNCDTVRSLKLVPTSIWRHWGSDWFSSFSAVLFRQFFRPFSLWTFFGCPNRRKRRE